MNLVALVVAIDTRLLFPFFMVSGPCALALFVIDRPLDLHHHVPKEVIWVLLVLASAAQYTVYGLLLNLRFPGRRLVLVLLLLFHVGSGVFLHVSGVQ